MVPTAVEDAQFGKECYGQSHPKCEHALMDSQPGLPHSFVFGHLISMGKVLAQYPQDL